LSINICENNQLSQIILKTKCVYILLLNLYILVKNKIYYLFIIKIVKKKLGAKSDFIIKKTKKWLFRSSYLVCQTATATKLPTLFSVFKERHSKKTKPNLKNTHTRIALTKRFVFIKKSKSNHQTKPTLSPQQYQKLHKAETESLSLSRGTLFGNIQCMLIFDSVYLYVTLKCWWIFCTVSRFL